MMAVGHRAVAELENERRHYYRLTRLGARVTALEAERLEALARSSFSTAQRTREVGVRMALGAARRDVVRLIVRDGMGVVVIGIGGARDATAPSVSLWGRSTRYDDVPEHDRGARRNGVGGEPDSRAACGGSRSHGRPSTRLTGQRLRGGS